MWEKLSGSVIIWSQIMKRCQALCKILYYNLFNMGISEEKLQNKK